VSRSEEVVWQGSPQTWPAIKTWAAVLAVILGMFALLYWYMATIGSCVTVLIETDCRPPRRQRMEVVFIVLAVMALGAFAVVVRTALGVPLYKYTVTTTEIRSQSFWPLTGTKVQPLASVTVCRRSGGIRFTGVGEKPVDFDHLAKGEVERLVDLVKNLKTAPSSGKPKGETP
jgi:hypothetical protein